jgi:hypothetical protein
MSGRDTARFVAAWAVGLAVLAALAPLVGERDHVALAELPAAVLGALLLAGGLLALRRRAAVDAPVASVSAPALGVGVTLAVAGAAVGLWLVLLSAPVIVLGLCALVMERRG